MRFFSIYTPSPDAPRTPPSKEMMAQMQTLVAESMKAGTLVMTGGLLPVSANGAVVRRRGGQTRVVDGPFTESKELVAGFAILEATSREHAIELTRNFLAVAGDGECILQQMMEPGAPPPNAR